MKSIFTSILLFLLVTQFTSSSRTLSNDCPTPRVKNGRIRSKGRGGRIIRYSCSPEYELVGNKYSICSRGSWDTPAPICVSTKCVAPPVPKHAMVGEQYKGAVLMYFCEPGYKLDGNTLIYCDGRQWNGTTPYCWGTNVAAPTSCDFENSNATYYDQLCWWEHDKNNEFNWERHQFQTPSTHFNTGPTHDHTLGAGYDGYYMYIETSGKQENSKAKLISPLYSANLTDSGCFSFWYHMYGTGIGSLNVYFKLETEKTLQLMWTMQGNQGNQWRQGLFKLPTTNTSFQLIIEGVRGQSYVSDIAIDDLALLQGDQCAIKNSTDTTPASDNDELEIFNAMQTCRNRCVNTLTETTPSSELYSNSDTCQCTIDCADTGSCCPDFGEYCVLEATDFADFIPVAKPVTNYTFLPTENYDSVSTTISTTIKNENFKTESTIQTTKSTTSPTTSKITATIVIEKETTVERKAPTRQEPMRTPTITSTTRANVQTPFFAPTHETAVTIDNAKSQAQPNVIIQDARKLEQSSSLSLPGIVGVIIGVLMGVSIIIAIALGIIRRQKSYKRSPNGSAFSEDSDVRFLTSDEVLDFSLARPADEDI